MVGSTVPTTPRNKIIHAPDLSSLPEDNMICYVDGFFTPSGHCGAGTVVFDTSNGCAYDST